jgi:hypothetical protein
MLARVEEQTAPPPGERTPRRRWLLLGISAAVLLVLAAAAAAYVWWYRPAVDDARANAAALFIQLPVATWHALHQQGASGLPSPYPARIEDLHEHGLLDEETLDFYRRSAAIEYFPPPPDLEGDARLNWVVVKASTPRGTWVGTLGGDRIWEPRP